MGDRANVVLEYEDQKRIWLYTHWGGSALHNTLQTALERGRSRWSDPSYLARIIFSEMIQHQLLEETGFGISPYPTDNEWPYLVVDMVKQEVRIEEDDRTDYTISAPPDHSNRYSFDQYTKLTADPRAGGSR